MILIRVRHALLLLATSLAATLGTGIWSYRAVSDAGLKGPAENVLFLSLCTAGAQVLIGAALFQGARRKRRELDSIADAVRYGGTLPNERLARFGPLGDRIRFILKELSESGERKSERISSLSSLLRSSLALVDAPVLVVALDGLVMEASKGARESPRFRSLETGKTLIEALVPEAQMSAVLGETDRTHSAVEFPGDVTFLPVYSQSGRIGHFLVAFSHSGLREFLAGLSGGEKKTRTEPAREGKSFLNRLRGRFRNGKSSKTDD